MRDTIPRMPKNKAEWARQLSDATCAGYFAGFNDRANGHAHQISTHQRANIRGKVRAEIWRWMAGWQAEGR